MLHTVVQYDACIPCVCFVSGDCPHRTLTRIDHIIQSHNHTTLTQPSQNVFRIVRSFGASIATYHIVTNFEYSMGSLPSNGSNGASAPWTMFEPQLPREPQLN